MRVPGWRNGRRCGLKIRCPKGRAGSTPALGTMTNLTVTSTSINLVLNSMHDLVRLSVGIEDLDDLIPYLKKRRPPRATLFPKTARPFGEISGAVKYGR